MQIAETKKKNCHENYASVLCHMFAKENGVMICIFQQAVFSVKSIFDSMHNTHPKYSD